jgi:hypothetical protein
MTPHPIRTGEPFTVPPLSGTPGRVGDRELDMLEGYQPPRGLAHLYVHDGWLETCPVLTPRPREHSLSTVVLGAGTAKCPTADLATALVEGLLAEQ